MQKDGEPSVEDILRSIKKVISRDDEAYGGQARATPSFGSARPFAQRETSVPQPASAASAPEIGSTAGDACAADGTANDADVYDLGNLPAGEARIEPDAVVAYPDRPRPADHPASDDNEHDNAATGVGGLAPSRPMDAREMAAAYKPEACPQPTGEPPEPSPAPTIRKAEDRLIAGPAAAAMRDQLAALSNLSAAAPKPESPPSPLEDAVRDMLRPLLKDWLDANLQGLVERMVQDEMARITGNR